MGSGFAIESWPDPPKGQPQQAAIRAVSSEYFATMKIPLWKGRSSIIPTHESRCR